MTLGLIYEDCHVKQLKRGQASLITTYMQGSQIEDTNTVISSIGNEQRIAPGIHGKPGLYGLLAYSSY